jgi:hypothetical protein
MFTSVRWYFLCLLPHMATPLRHTQAWRGFPQQQVGSEQWPISLSQNYPSRPRSQSTAWKMFQGPFHPLATPLQGPHRPHWRRPWYPSAHPSTVPPRLPCTTSIWMTSFPSCRATQNEGGKSSATSYTPSMKSSVPRHRSTTQTTKSPLLSRS